MKLRLVVAVMAAAVLTACSLGGGAPLTAGSQAPKSAASSAPKATVLNVYTGWNGQFVENWNIVAPGVTYTHGAGGMIYETLMFFNQAKADDVQPVLASSYELGPDGKSITFTLREGVKWSDGQPFTAEDVAFNFTYRRDNKELNTAPPSSLIKDAQVVDPTHVTVSFTEPIYTQVWQLAGQTYMVPKHIWEKIDKPAKEINKNPVGTGPFMLDTFDPNSYTLKKNPNYWESGKPKIEGLRFWTFNNNEAAIAALASGQIDWMGGSIPDIETQYVAKDPEHNKYKNEAYSLVTNLVPNLTKAPFNDVAVRQAVNTALDRNKIIELAFAGQGKPTTPAGLVLPIYQDYVAPELAGKELEYNADKSRQTLEAAGYKKNADGYYEKDGKELSITCHVVTGWSDFIATMQIAQQQLKEVGIKFKSKEVSFAAFTDVMQRGDFQMVIWNGWGGPHPYYMYNNILSSKSIPPVNQNMARWKNATVDKALAAIASTPMTDIDSIKQQVWAIQRELVKEVPYIPIQQAAALAEFRTQNAVGWPSEENPYAQSLPFSQPDMGIVAKNIEPAKP